MPAGCAACAAWSSAFKWGAPSIIATRCPTARPFSIRAISATSSGPLRTVASVNAVALITGACAPAAPKNVKAGGAVTNDTTLSWDIGTEADLAGYEIVIRETTVDDWERVIPVGKVAKYTFKDFTIDNVFMGVRAVDKDGNRSPVRTPEERLP